MSYKSPTWILLLFFNCTYSQNAPPHGTFIISAICPDGILIIADSRSSFVTGENEFQKPYAYYDSTKKIFSIGKFKMGVLGKSMLAKRFLNQLTDEFTSSHSNNNSIQKTFYEFLSFLRTNYHLTDSSIFDDNKYIVAGYEDSTPAIMAFTKPNEPPIVEKRIKGSIYSDTIFKKYFINLNGLNFCQNVAIALENSIYQYAKDYNKLDVGGPLYVIKINENNSCKELKTFTSTNYKTYTDLAEAILNKKIKMTFLYPYSEDMMIKTLIEGIKKGN